MSEERCRPSRRQATPWPIASRRPCFDPREQTKRGTTPRRQAPRPRRPWTNCHGTRPYRRRVPPSCTVESGSLPKRGSCDGWRQTATTGDNGSRRQTCNIKRWQNLAYAFAHYFRLLGRGSCLLGFQATNVHESHSGCTPNYKQRIWTKVNASPGNMLPPNPPEEERPQRSPLRRLDTPCRWRCCLQADSSSVWMGVSRQ